MRLSFLIVLHEFGHFFFARLFKTRVEKFYLFFDFLFPFSNMFNFSLFKKTKGDTEYGIGWFPLGGYVKISGMVDESMDKEALALPPQPLYRQGLLALLERRRPPQRRPVLRAERAERDLLALLENRTAVQEVDVSRGDLAGEPACSRARGCNDLLALRSPAWAAG